MESKQQLWELIKIEIRSKTISYSNKKRAELNSREVAIQNNLEELDYEICNNVDLEPHVRDEYEAAKKRIQFFV